MNLEELFVEKYKALEEKVEELEKVLNEKNKIILEGAFLMDAIRENMWIENTCADGKYICFLKSPCLFENYNKEKFDEIVRIFRLRAKENENDR